MKILIALLVSLVSVTAFADCRAKLTTRLYNSLEKEGHGFHGVDPMDDVEVMRLARGSDELNAKQVEAIEELNLSPAYEAYLLTASAGPAGYQDLFFVSAKTCNTVRRFTVYIE